jgi:hypothetical protein
MRVKKRDTSSWLRGLLRLLTRTASSEHANAAGARWWRAGAFCFPSASDYYFAIKGQPPSSSGRNASSGAISLIRL